MSLDVSKELLESLNYFKDVVIGKLKFTISLLTYEEEQKVSSMPKEEEEPLIYYEKTRSQILSYSIKKFNDVEIPSIIEVEKEGKKELKERAIYIREEILQKMPIKVIDILFDAYVDFKDEIETKMEKEVNYKWFKTPEEREIEKRDKLNKIAQETKEEKPIEFRKIEENIDNNKVE